MKPRQRLLAVLERLTPDCVPCSPDFSNMIPCRRTGKSFWDIYLYNDPPLWKAYIECAKYFDIDTMFDAYYIDLFPAPPGSGPEWQQFIVCRTDERIVTQQSYVEDGKRIWRPTVDVYRVANPPVKGIEPKKIGLPRVPERYEPVEGAKPPDTGEEALRTIKEALGDQGLVGVGVTSTLALHNPEEIYRYYDNPDKHE